MKFLEEIAGLPAHPVYVHFPVTLFILSSFFLLMARFDGQGHRLNRSLKKIGLGGFEFESFSLLSLLLGFGMGVVAVASGIALVDGWKHLPIPHGPLGLTTVGCYFVALVIRWVFGTAVYGRGLKWFYYGLHAVGILLVLLTGFEGGELHYEHLH